MVSLPGKRKEAPRQSKDTEVNHDHNSYCGSTSSWATDQAKTLPEHIDSESDVSDDDALATAKRKHKDKKSRKKTLHSSTQS